MPILEFYSPDSHKVYMFYARNADQAARIPKCPDDPSYRMERMISRFSVTGLHKEDEENEAVDDRKMEAAMRELEREMSGIDESNPDPRQMGSLLRRMSELTGEKLPGNMEEMVRRLEEGADPEALEEEFGEVLEDNGDNEDGDDAMGSRINRWWKKKRSPEKDPKLYDYDEVEESR